jgi:hypothetical protein
MREQDIEILNETYKLIEDIETQRQSCREVIGRERHNLYKLDLAEKQGWEVINDILDRNKPAIK